MYMTHEESFIFYLPFLAFQYDLQTSDLSISEKHIQGKALLNHNFLRLSEICILTSLSDSGEDWLSLWEQDILLCLLTNGSPPLLAVIC